MKSFDSLTPTSNTEDHAVRNVLLRTTTLLGGCALISQSLFELVARKPLKAAIVAATGGLLVANAFGSEHGTFDYKS